MNERSAYLSSMFCFLAGGVAGAGISLLLAPQSGKATRQMMAGKVRGGRPLRPRAPGPGRHSR